MKSVKFYFDVNDSEHSLTTQTVPSSKPNNLTQNVYIKTPIYDKNSVKIGYKLSNDIIQQLSHNEYAIRIQNTYFIEGLGSINSEYAFINSKPQVTYTPNIVIESTISSGTGNFMGAKGRVAINPTPDGRRYVIVNFEN